MIMKDNYFFLKKYNGFIEENNKSTQSIGKQWRWKSVYSHALSNDVVPQEQHRGSPIAIMNGSAMLREKEKNQEALNYRTT